MRWVDGIKVAYERCSGFKVDETSAYSLESFDASREPEAHAAMLRLASDQLMRCALLPAGPVPAVGCGKTHLLRAAMAKLQAEGYWCVLLEGHEIARQADTQWGNWSKCEALFLDHLGRDQESHDGRRPPDSYVGSLLVRLLDERKLITCVASSMPMMQLRAKYGPELASRLEGMHRPKLKGEDYRRC